eukprot:TRINITY_DN1783_c0_g1_i10.p1 TRINITY_DN1783_c0_g1~~TRINITY_DN1783_c0_g1_i10.p1  ORF type:complete len:593 (+),score=141.28 TRINITY_DN1783_c0_g1_i10:1507-3285(+)
MAATPTVARLVAEAVQGVKPAEWRNVPLKKQLHSAGTLIELAKTSDLDGDASKAFLYYIRYLEMLMKVVQRNPEFKQVGAREKAAITQSIVDTMETTEKLKDIIRQTFDTPSATPVEHADVQRLHTLSSAFPEVPTVLPGNHAATSNVATNPKQDTQTAQPESEQPSQPTQAVQPIHPKHATPTQPIEPAQLAQKPSQLVQLDQQPARQAAQAAPPPDELLATAPPAPEELLESTQSIDTTSAQLSFVSQLAKGQQTNTFSSLHDVLGHPKVAVPPPTPQPTLQPLAVFVTLQPIKEQPASAQVSAAPVPAIARMPSMQPSQPTAVVPTIGRYTPLQSPLQTSVLSASVAMQTPSPQPLQPTAELLAAAIAQNMPSPQLLLPSAVSPHPQMQVLIPVCGAGAQAAAAVPQESYKGISTNREVVVDGEMIEAFLVMAQGNTVNDIETCGILAGVLRENVFHVTHCIVPQQNNTKDTCVMLNEDALFQFQDQHSLLTLGWIHTHPTQSLFMSSVDLHTQFPYQQLLPEAVAIVIAPKFSPNCGIFALTVAGKASLAACSQSGFHLHDNTNLYCNASHVRVCRGSPTFQLADLRS